MVTFESDGSLTFRVYLPHAECVSLVADFTDWQSRAVPLRREERAAEDEHCGEGWWSATVHPTDGDHAFSYLVDGQWWLPDYAAHGVRRNEEGSWTSLLFVPPPPRILKRITRRCRFDTSEVAESAPAVVVKPTRTRTHSAA